MVTFRILFGIAALATAVLLAFFVRGLQDGSVLSSDIPLWGALLAAPVAILGGAAALRSGGRVRSANVLLLLLAAPATLLGLFVLLLALASVHWG